MGTLSIVTIALILVGAVIIIALGVYAGRLLFLVKAQDLKKQTVRNKRIASMQSSIQTIAFAMQQQQCDLSEGVIRICRLLESLSLDPLPDYNKQYPATHALFELVKDYPTHEQRSALSKQERRQQDKQRHEFESELESKILKETEALRIFIAK
jgi:hypothetical protein